MPYAQKSAFISQRALQTPLHPTFRTCKWIVHRVACQKYKGLLNNATKTLFLFFFLLPKLKTTKNRTSQQNCRLKTVLVGNRTISIISQINASSFITVFANNLFYSSIFASICFPYLLKLWGFLGSKLLQEVLRVQRQQEGGFWWSWGAAAL